MSLKTKYDPNMYMSQYRNELINDLVKASYASQKTQQKYQMTITQSIKI